MQQRPSKACRVAVVALIASTITITPVRAAEPALPAIETAAYDAQGRFQVNGKPFFPIMLYGVPTDEATLKQLHQFGFNVLACRPQECEALPAQGFYGAIHVGRKFEAGIAGVLLTIGTDSPALYYKQDLLKQTAAANAKVTALVPNRPIMNAIGYWIDEPEGVFAGKLPSRAVYEDLVAAIDVAAPYLYPVPYQPVASVGEAVARARQATNGTKPVLPVLQLFTWKPTDRYPTPDELRCMAFLALVEGAQGIGYYSYNTVTGPQKSTIADVQPALWQSVKELNRDLASLGPQLLFGKPAGDVQCDADRAVKAKIFRRDERLLIVLVNSSPAKQGVHLNVTAAGGPVLRLMHRDQALSMRDRQAMLTLAPFEAAVLEEVRP